MSIQNLSIANVQWKTEDVPDLPATNGSSELNTQESSPNIGNDVCNRADYR